MNERWNGFVAAMLAVVMLMLTAAGAVAQGSTPVAAPEDDADLQGAVSWLMAQQADDGGFPGMSGESEASVTIDAIIALAAADEHGIDTDDAIDMAITWLTSGDTALVFAQTGQGQAAKLVLGAVAAGIDPTNIAGVNPVALIDAGVNPDTGMYGSGIFDHALVMLALAATGSDVPDEAVAALEATQTPEGGWAFDGTATSGAADSNTTALVVEALAAVGEVESPMVADALDYLQTAIVADGAVFQPGADQPADSSSTAMVAQAALAAGSRSDVRWLGQPRGGSRRVPE